jgi:hypothetical protein
MMRMKIGAVALLVAGCARSEPAPLDHGDASTTAVAPAAASVAHDAAGTARLLTKLTNRPDALALDDSSVYMGIEGAPGQLTGSIARIPRSGGTPASLVEDRNNASRLSVDGEFVYYVGFVDEAPFLVVRRVPKGGGPAQTVCSDGSAGNDVAVDDTHVWWSSGDEILRARKSGGAAERVARGRRSPRGVVVDSEDAYWLEGGGGAGAHVDIVRLSKAGGAPVVFVSDSHAARLALDRGDLYWTLNSGESQIARAAKSDGRVTRLGCPGVAPDGLALAATFVVVRSARALVPNPFFPELDAARLPNIYALPKSGADPVVIARDEPAEYVALVAADAKGVVWVGGAGGDAGRVMALAAEALPAVPQQAPPR